MRKLIALSAVLICGQLASADVLNGICEGLTFSGRTVVMSFCSPSSGGSRLVACNHEGRGPVKVHVYRKSGDEMLDQRTLVVRYSRITNNEEGAFAAVAYNVSRRQLRFISNPNWISVNAYADEPSQFAMDLGLNWKFEFRNANCRFENLDQYDQDEDDGQDGQQN